MRHGSRRKSPLFVAIGVLLIAASVYLSFELGRYEAGYTMFDERRSVRSLEAMVDERDEQIAELTRQIAILETSRDIDTETYARVESNLTDLQKRIQGLEEELAFYRGIVSPGDGVAGLRIQNVELLAEDGGSELLLRLLLVQSIVHKDRVTGTVHVRVNGELHNEATVLALEELVADGSNEIQYGFRYFQSLEQRLSLPEGFEPIELEIEIWPREPRGETVMQSFLWDSLSS
jgi:hypothetical protein